MSFLVNSAPIFGVENSGNACFDAEDDMHLLSLGNRAFSSNPGMGPVRQVRDVCHKRVGNTLMVAREFGLLANRRAEKTVAIVFQIRVELLRRKGAYPTPR